MAMAWTLFFLGTAFCAFVGARAAPTKYDQRQDGDTNVHGKLENILFVAVIPKNTVQISDLALDVLGQLLAAQSKEESIKSSEAVRSEEPYFAEVLQITENRPDKEDSVRKAEADAGTLNILDQSLTFVKQTERAERIARNMKNFEFPKSREVPTISGYFVNTRKMHGPKTGNSRARNIGIGSSPDGIESEISLKKQLPQKGEEEVTLPLSNSDKNDVSSLEN